MARTRNAGQRVNIQRRCESRSVPRPRTHRNLRVKANMRIRGTSTELPDPAAKAPSGGGVTDVSRYSPNCHTQSNPNLHVDWTDHILYKTDIECVDGCGNPELTCGRWYKHLSDRDNYVVHRHQPRISEQEEGLDDCRCEVGNGCVMVRTANIGLPCMGSMVMPPRTMSVVGWDSGQCELLEIPRGHKTPCLPLPPGIEFVEPALVAELLDMLAGQTTIIFNLCMDGHREVVAKRALQQENQKLRGLLKTAVGNDCVWMGLDWQFAATLQEPRPTMQSSPTVHQNGHEEKNQAAGRIDNISCYPSGDDDIEEGQGDAVYSGDKYFVDGDDNHDFNDGGICSGGNQCQHDGSTGPSKKKHAIGGVTDSTTHSVGKLAEGSGDSGGCNKLTSPIVNGPSTRSRSKWAKARNSKRLKRGV